MRPQISAVAQCLFAEDFDMKRYIAVALIAGMLTSAATGQEATLETASKEAYEESLVEMARPIGEERGRELILQLLILATGKVPDGADPTTFRFNAMAALMADPQLFLDGIAPYQGMTAGQIMAIDTSP